MLFIALFALAGRGQAQERQEITVSAALSLKAAFEEIGRLFEQSRPGTRVLFNFAASGVLQRQIESGAPVDVFASASAAEIDALERKGLLLPGTRKDLARNGMVLIKGAGQGPALTSFEDLAGPEIKRIAMGNPATVPAGKYSVEVLRHYHLYDTLRDRLVLCENVRQVLDYVARGEVDAGLVFLTDAKGRTHDVAIVAAAAPESHAPAIYQMAVTAGSRQQETAGAFVLFTSTAKARSALAKQGFRSAQ
jgi:molybdate transport system substrate-binding protein